MATHLIAMFAAVVVSYAIHWLVGDHVSLIVDFLLGAVFGGAAYIYTFYKLRML